MCVGVCTDGVSLDRNVSDMSVTLKSSEELQQPTPVYWDVHANGLNTARNHTALVTVLTLYLMDTLKPHGNGPLVQQLIGTLAADGWAVTFATARRGLGGLGPRPVPSSLYQI